MKKRLFILAIVLCSIVSLSGCKAFNILSDIGQSTVDVYSALDSLAANPDGSTELDGRVSFVAYVATEAFEETFEDDDKTYMYQIVYICRNMNDPIHVDVTDIKTKLPADSYATITGEVVGNLYWTEDNRQKKVLDFCAVAMDPFEPSDQEPNTENQLVLKDSTKSGVVEFVGAHYSSNTFNKKFIVVYLNFKNTAEDTNVKLNGLGNLIKDFVVMRVNDEYMDSINTAIKPDDIDSAALDAFSLQAYTYSGKTQMYYLAIEVDKDADPAEHIWAEVYDDEFAFTNSIAIPVAASLEDMK